MNTCRDLLNSCNRLKSDKLLMSNEHPKNILATHPLINKDSSMSSLIVWNISKAFEKNPQMELKSAIKEVQERLQRNTADINELVSQCSGDRHLACAMLAWQQLGHEDAESLYHFVQKKRNEKQVDFETQPKLRGYIDYNVATDSKGVECGSFISNYGPVVKLPVATHLVMRMDSSGGRNPPPKHDCLNKKSRTPKDVMNKIDAACCFDSECAKRLAELDNATNDLRSRACRLAKREAERVELLEKAEAAWRDLEIGYQRRWRLAEDKEQDATKNIQRLIEERNNYKEICISLVQQLKQKSELAEKDRNRLMMVEQDLCELACTRHKLSQDVAKVDAALSEASCKAAQLDRELQFNEEHARRRVVTLNSDIESVQVLTNDLERAMRAELGGIRQQLNEVSARLLKEDADCNMIKEELKDLKEAKQEMVEDLDGCKVTCDGQMQGLLDTLKKKSEELKELQERVIECRCKLPMDSAVEVKRTPSLAALCHCSPEDRLLESCSCTSLRSRMLSNLFSDLFSGLQSELGNTGSQMPCQLLKCLEDKHNWDRASIVKTNLRNFFSCLLVKELDIAIATAIEKYHAKWVGASCADAGRLIPEPGDDQAAGWEGRALERRAQQLATKLAEQLFEEKADQLTQRAKDIVAAGPPPCACQPQPQPLPSQSHKTYQCLVDPPTIGRENDVDAHQWRRTRQEVTVLRAEMEELKREINKREDGTNEKRKSKTGQVFEIHDGFDQCVPDKEDNHHKDRVKIANSRKRALDYSNTRELNIVSQKEKQMGKVLKKSGQSFAVNMCLCDTVKDSSKIPKPMPRKEQTKNWKQKTSKDAMSKTSSIKQSKPIFCLPSNETQTMIMPKKSEACAMNCHCFNKVPSTTSIQKLFDTLTKWKCDLTQDPDVKVLENTESKKDCNKPDISADKKPGNINNITLANLPVNINQLVTTDAEMKIQDTVNLIPMTTASEYMGAINLEKSNEIFCRCVKSRKTKSDAPGDTKLIFKCINTQTCNCKKELDKSIVIPIRNQHTIMSSQTQTERDSLNDIFYKKREEKFGNPKSCNSNGTKNNVQNQENCGNKVEGYEIIPKPSQLESRDCNYNIKFLGVTLAKDNENNLVKIKEEPSSEKKTQRCYLENGYIKTRPYTTRLNTTKFCIMDKAVDAQSFKGVKTADSSSFSFLGQEDRCICCNGENFEECKNLEENTFVLLKEHLKGRMEEYKTSSSFFVTIPPEDEEKLYSSMLHKIKKVISDNTKKISCQCVIEKSCSGSWSRANGLLQEYLKSKIQRVQCLCSDINTESQNNLPNLLNKVCKMIDKDFERLKQTWNNKEIVIANFPKSVISEENCLTAKIPDNIEENKHIDKENDTKETIEEKKTKSEIKLASDAETKIMLSTPNESSKISIPVVQTASSQVPSNLGMESKYCEPMVIVSSNLDESLNRENNTHASATTATNFSCDCALITTTTINHCGDLITSGVPNNNADNTNLMTSTTNIFNTESFKVNTGLPYVGFTVNCSCDGAFGTCVCAKSKLKTNDEKVKNIWNTFVYNRKDEDDLSYIMNTATNKGDKKILEIKPNTPTPESITKSEINERFDTHNNSQIKNFLLKSSIKSSKTNTDAKASISKNNNLSQTKISTDYSKKQSYEAKTCTTQSSEFLLIKNVDVPNVEQNHTATNTFNFDSASECCDDMSDWESLPSDVVQNDVTSNDPKLKHSLYFPLDYPAQIELTEENDNISENCNNAQKLSEVSQCDCNMVPICHVKMLVENIENRLVNSKCTCDSLSPKVCPMHLKSDN